MRIYEKYFFFNIRIETHTMTQKQNNQTRITCGGCASLFRAVVHSHTHARTHTKRERQRWRDDDDDDEEKEEEGLKRKQIKNDERVDAERERKKERYFSD